MGGSDVFLRGGNVLDAPPELGDPHSSRGRGSLYTAIVTDCGNFAFSCTTPRTHQAAADLLSLGVAPEKIDQLIRCSRTMEGLRLRGRALERVRSVGSFAAVTWIGKTDFQDTGSSPSETEFLVNELLTVRSVSFAVLLVEDDDCVRASLRSRGTLSASEIAHAFGGGGHPQAAGCRLPLPLDEAVTSLTAFLEEKNDTLRSAAAR
jgi:phosphoesterase RecJ-like protein